TRDFLPTTANASPLSSSNTRRDCAPGAPTPSILRRKSWRAPSTTPSITCRSARSTASRNSRPRTQRQRTPDPLSQGAQHGSAIREVAVGLPAVAALARLVSAVVEPRSRRPLLNAHAAGGPNQRGVDAIGGR